MCVQLAGKIYDDHAFYPTTAPSTNTTTTTSTITTTFKSTQDNLFLPGLLSNPGDKTCTGSDCFFETYAIIASLCGMATLLSLVLVKRTWSAYLRTMM